MSCLSSLSKEQLAQRQSNQIIMFICCEIVTFLGEVVNYFKDNVGLSGGITCCTKAFLMGVYLLSS